MRRIHTLLALLFVPLLFSCKPSPEKIRIGYLPLLSNLPLFVAMNHGYFTERGLTPELVPFQTSNAMTEALVSGSIDAEAGAASLVTVTVAQSSADRLRVLMGIVITPEHSISALIVSKSSTVQSVADLRGKKVGVFPGSAIKQFTRLYMMRHNAFDESTTLLELPPPLQLQALENGSVDAVLTLEPTPTIGLTKGAVRVIDLAPIEREILNPWVGGVYSVSRVYEKDHPKAVEELTESLRKAVEFIGSSPDSAKKAMISFTPIKDPAVLRRLPVPQFVMADQLSVADFQKLSDLLSAQGILKQPVDVAGLLKK